MQNQVKKRGLLLVVSAPSGAGKNSLLNKILVDDDNFVMTVSHTTRAPRAGEVNKVSYHFINPVDFQQMVDDKCFIEYAEVHGNLYGTSKHEIIEKRESGKHVILEIDVEGARQIKQQFSEAVLIFMVPPSFQVLQERLQDRQTDSDEMIALRIKNASLEIKQAVYYDYLVVNDDFETALYDLKCIIRAEELATFRNQDILDNIMLTKLRGI